jgi:2-dehydropantoate 2-reductase
MEVAGPRLLVVGCGGIGGIVAAHLFEQGHDVTALTTNRLIADAINASGFRVRGEAAPGTVRGRAVQAVAPGTRPFDYVLLATQPPQVEEAARRALPFLAPAGAMVCFQNGLCEERIRGIAGPDRVLGAIVAWGAAMGEPGVYDRTSAGGFVIGRLDGADDPRVDELARILEAIGPTNVTRNLAGARWSKLAINCAISSIGTVGGDLDWIALTDAERKAATGSPGLFAKHALLLAVGARYRRLRSSMLAAIERGRPPAVDFLNGEVVQRGAALGVPTPVRSSGSPPGRRDRATSSRARSSIGRARSSTRHPRRRPRRRRPRRPRRRPIRSLMGRSPGPRRAAPSRWLLSTPASPRRPRRWIRPSRVLKKGRQASRERVAAPASVQRCRYKMRKRSFFS